MRKNNAFDAKIVHTRLTKIFIAIFAPDERLPSSATLDDDDEGYDDDDDYNGDDADAGLGVGGGKMWRILILDKSHTIYLSTPTLPQILGQSGGKKWSWEMFSLLSMTTVLLSK